MCGTSTFRLYIRWSSLQSPEQHKGWSGSRRFYHTRCIGKLLATTLIGPWLKTEARTICSWSYDDIRCCKRRWGGFGAQSVHASLWRGGILKGGKKTDRTSIFADDTQDPLCWTAYFCCDYRLDQDIDTTALQAYIRYKRVPHSLLRNDSAHYRLAFGVDLRKCTVTRFRWPCLLNCN